MNFSRYRNCFICILFSRAHYCCFYCCFLCFCCCCCCCYCQVTFKIGISGSVGSDCSRCAECIGTSGLCAYCPPGYWGFTCDRVCSTLDCKDNICSQFSASCVCKTGFYGMAISRGFQCIPCPKNCVECAGPFEECLSCIDGKFGNKCEMDCSKEVLNVLQLYMALTRTNVTNVCLVCMESRLIVRSTAATVFKGSVQATTVC